MFSQTKILSLQECLDLALEQSNELQIKQEEVKIAEYKKAQAKTAYLPKVNALLSYLHLSDDIYLLSEDKFLPIGTKMADGSFGFRADQVNNGWTVINGNPVPLDVNGNPFDPKANPEKIEWKDYTTIPRDELAIDARNTFVGALSLIQPIYMGGKVRQTNKMAEIGIDIAKEQEILQQSDVLYQTEGSYWTVISVSNKVRTAEDYKNLLIALEKNVTELFNEGMATKADILKVKVKLNEIDMNLTKAQNGLSLAKMQLCQYIGLPMNTDIQLSDEIATESLKSASDGNVNLDAAWENRPEVSSLRKLIDLSETKEKIAFADYLPEVALIANYMVTNPDFFNGFEKDFSGSWNIGVTMKIPILHWGEQKQKVREAKSEKHINELKLDDAKEKIELQFRQAVYKIEETGKRLTAAENNFDQAKENLKYAELSYDEGIVSVTDVLDAQAAWYSAYSEKEDALIGLRIDNLYLKKVAGQLVAKK
jgi:outer membrane protein TolC